MTRTGIAILAVCFMFLSWLSLALLLLVYGNDWWLSGLTTLTVFAWLAGLLAVIYQQGRIRAAATGAVIAAAAYWLLALGPWFSLNVGPTLLTSRFLASADALLHGTPPQMQTLVTYPQAPPTFVTGGSGAIAGSTIQTSFIPQTYTVVTNSAVSPGGSVFQSLGHWLFIWLGAGIGACAALWMQMRSEKKQPRAPSSAVGESPFAAPSPISPVESQGEANRSPPGAAS